MEENRKTELMNLAGRLERLRRLMGQDMPQPVQQSAPAVEEGEKQEKMLMAAIPFLDQEYQRDLYGSGAAHGNAADAHRRRPSGPQPGYSAAICAQKADAFSHSPLPVPRRTDKTGYPHACYGRKGDPHTKGGIGWTGQRHKWKRWARNGCG